MAKKSSSRTNSYYSKEKQINRPSKPRYTNKANSYYREEVAPIQRSYNQAMRMGLYDEAIKYFEALQIAKKEHRILLSRNEQVRIK